MDARSPTADLQDLPQRLAALGRRLREERLRQRLTAEVLAERAGITRVTLRRIEAGRADVDRRLC